MRGQRRRKEKRLRAQKSDWWEGWGDRTYLKRLANRIRRRLSVIIARLEQETP